MRFPRILPVLFTVFFVGILAGSALAQRALHSPFPDVPAESNAADSIHRFTLLGLLTGYESGFFGPSDALTRAQATLLLSRFEDRMIEPLRKQIEEMRQILDLGWCGDGLRQTGEECDDGNKTDEDGCSPECLREDIPGRSEELLDSVGEAPASPPSLPSTPLRAGEENIPEPESELPSQSAPLCGNGVCEIYENVLPPHRRFHCPMDCTGEPFQRQCNAVKTDVLSLSNEETACGSNTDCVAVRQSCPHITCGIAVNKSNYPSISLAMDNALDTCRREGMITECVLCEHTVAVCKTGHCVLQKAGQ